MADQATVNALKALTRAVDEQTRVMKDQSITYRRIQNVLEAFNANYVEAHKLPFYTVNEVRRDG